ncbi:MAG: hypothetical protein HY534_07815 [Chloroflexi bacterium]|nr:hypothetical protein [Chloroflexota bacterium]
MAKIWSFWLLGKLLAIALAAGSVWLIKTAIVAPEFEATEAIITGGELVPAEELAASLDLGGKNVFLIRSRYLVSLLEAHPAIRSAVVRPSFNGLVHVDMTEREAVAVWDSGSQQVLVDTDGIVLREGSRDLPTVYSVASGRISEGGRVDLSAVRIAARVGSELDGLGLSGGRIVHDPGSGVSIVGPWHRVLLGSSDQLEAKLQAYRTIRSYLDDTGTPAQLVDVRSLDRPYFR